MNFLPQASGMRPRVACEIAPGGVVAARAETDGPLSAVASATLQPGALAPGLKPGNVVDRVAVVAALRRTLEDVGLKSNARNTELTLVIPDGACRVLLLDFDSLPSKLAEALPLVRFRLKKLVPFDTEAAMVSFQIMSQTRQITRVLAVAIPNDVLAEYETVAREAGFEPGAVLPSTLASLAAVDDASAALLVNVSLLNVTTAITRDGVLLLHRTVDLHAEPVGVPVDVPPALVEPSGVDEFVTLPIVSREETQAEWAAQEPLPEHGHNPYADRIHDEEAAQNFGSVTALPEPPVFAASHEQAAPSVQEGDALPSAEFAREVAQAVSVAAAYFEDTLAALPESILSAGAMGAGALQRLLGEDGLTEADHLRVHELVTAEALAADAVSATIARGTLAGVVGALRA